MKIKDNIIFKHKPIVRVTQKRCLKDYKKYRHPKNSKKKNQIKGDWEFEREFQQKYKSLAVIEGLYIGKLNKTDENIIIPSHDFGQSHFYNNLNDIRIVPTNYIEVKHTKKELMGKSADFVCKKPSRKIMNLEKKGLNFLNWKESSRKHWLQIKDIKKLSKGDKIKLLVLDRNIVDILDSKVKYNKIYKPNKFFAFNWAIYTHNKDLQGEIFYSWQQEEIDKKNINNQKGGNSTYVIGSIDNTKPYKFEFDINYTKGLWFPLEKGYLPAKGDFGENLLDGKRKKWNKFPNDTYIGWRGPMILWKNLDKLPDIYHLNLEV